MSDSYVVLEAKAAKTRNSTFERVLKRMAIALLVILAAELVWFFGFLPCLPFAVIEVSGSLSLSREEVLSVAGINGKSSFINSAVSELESALEAKAHIADAVVTKRFPDSLVITLKERSMVTMTLIEFGGRIIPAQIDAEGVVFRLGSATAKDRPSIDSYPIISGDGMERVGLGTKFSDELKPLFASLALLRSQAPALLGAVSEIKVEKRAYGGYELTLFPSHYTVKVKLGSELNEDSLRYMMLVLDVLASEGINADELDFRTGTAVYRAKEASSG